MPAFLAFIAALFVTAYSLRGADSFSLATISGFSWGIAAAITAIVFHFRRTPRISTRIWSYVALAYLPTASVVFTRWPTSQRVGPFTIRRGEIERGLICLWTDLNPAGRSGYIRGLEDSGANPINAWSLSSAGSDWRFLVED